MNRQPVQPNKRRAPLFVLAVASCASATLAWGQASPEIEFFEKKIRPVLTEKCYKCHSATAEKIKGGLILDAREGIRAGGDSGHAVVPGDLQASMLIKAIRYTDPDLQMPPKKEGGKLSDEVIHDFEAWIKMGAPDPRDGKQAVVQKTWDTEKGRKHWAFQQPKKSEPPAVKNSSWPKNEIDRFILAKLDEHKLTPVADADSRTLIRRLSFDLIGLPPAPDEIETFVKEIQSTPGDAQRAIEKLVDRFLASPQFGERWGRHWLDVARYAESSGKENNIAYPHAWRYRDYVIQSFNEDKPYDLFLKEQLAGDRLSSSNDTVRAEQLIATGYLAIGPKSHNTRNPRQFALDLADEQIDAVSQGMLGLTVACARCHDHKFDPISQKDYYALAGIFLSTETRFGTPRAVQNNQATPLLTLPENADLPDAPPLSPPQLAALKRQLEQVRKERDDLFAEARANPTNRMAGNPRIIRINAQLGILEKQLERYDEDGRLRHLAMGADERIFPRNAAVLQRGELDKPLETVPRGFVEVILSKQAPKIAKGSGRLELADWIASRENPLTARVMVNRIWAHLFGQGLVPTPDNFGTTGQKPTHPDLLDYLAVRFTDDGWSIKRLIREIVLSRSYQLSSDFSAADYAADPDNTWRWRMSKRRLDAESIRDAMLAAAGRLDLTPPRGSPVANAEGPVLQLLRPGGGPAARFGAMAGRGGNPLQQDRNFRSVYLPIVRDQIPVALATFDFAEPSLVVGNREETTVPSQALYILNGATVQSLATAMASRLLAESKVCAQCSQRAFSIAYGRPASEREVAATKDFLKKFTAAESENYNSKDALDRAALAALCQALLGSAEFRYLN